MSKECEFCGKRVGNRGIKFIKRAGVVVGLCQDCFNDTIMKTNREGARKAMTILMIFISILVTFVMLVLQ